MFRASLCPLSGERLYKTACGVSLYVLAAVVWSQDTSALCESRYSTVRSAGVLTPHNRSQHFQAISRRGFIQSVSWRWALWCPKHVDL